MFGGTLGVIRTSVGYAGGRAQNPSYYDIKDYTEVVEIDYDPDVISYEALLSMFWKSHNPTIPSRRQYISLIVYHSEEQKVLAQNSLQIAKQKIKDEVHTEVVPQGKYYEAEDYHQKYLLQQHPWLVRSMHMENNLVRSHACAKINGYLGHYGSLDELQNEGAKLGLNDEMIAYVRKQVHLGNT